MIVEAENPRIHDAVVDVQGELIELAQGTTFDHWRAQVIALFTLLDQEGGFDPDRDRPASTFTMSPTTGELRLRGGLTGDGQHSFREAIETQAGEIRRRIQADNERSGETAMPTHGELNALALQELVDRGRAVDLNQTRRVSPPEMTFVVPADKPDRDL